MLYTFVPLKKTKQNKLQLAVNYIADSCCLVSSFPFMGIGEKKLCFAIGNGVVISGKGLVYWT